jgi:uncharacterized protein (TIGR02594 family)
VSNYDAVKKAKIEELWAKAEIKPEHVKESEAHCKRIVDNKARYEVVSKATSVPWYAIGLLHTMESDCDFETHLHNGDPLKARTVQVPAGRPVKGNPPFTWEESAIDALQYDELAGVTDWSVAHLLYLAEKYNGFGFERRELLSAYIWAATTVETKGKYVSDGVWDPNAMSDQIGCAAMLKLLIAQGQVGGSPTLPPVVDVPVDAKVAKWIINSTDASDVRGYNKAGKCVAYLDTGLNLDTLIKSMAVYDPKAKYSLSIGALSPKPPVIPAPKPTPTPTPAPAPVADFSSTFIHLKNVKNDIVLTEASSAALWNAMQSQIQDKAAFNNRVNLGVKPEYGNAQCATTTASVLEGAALKAGLPNVAELFSKPHRDKDEFALTHQIEIMLKRLGFAMYAKATNVAPQGAVAMMAGRYDFAGCSQHSGHVYSLYEDKGVGQHDIICDNGGWNHIYNELTESFFVPGGIEVQKRDPKPTPTNNINSLLVTEAKKYEGVHEVGGNNMGPDVQKFQKAVDGVAEGEAWCMAFVQYCIKQVEAAQGIKSAIFRSEHCLTTWQKSPISMRLAKPEAGCVVIWQHGTTSNGHTGFVMGTDASGNLLTIEGNTNLAGSSEGDGVYAKTRDKVSDGDMKVVGFLKVFN